MPRRGRLHIPGGCYHIIGRGLERRCIFDETEDKEDFLYRFGENLILCQAQCLAWALMSNHYHFLLRINHIPLSKMMAPLLGGFAGCYNRRHNRCGYVFQNRFKSILVDADNYLMELVRYIHLNPVRARMVETIVELENYRWTGHAGVCGKHHQKWHSIDQMLGFFGQSRNRALENYSAFLNEGESGHSTVSLSGGGLLRSVGSWENLSRLRKEHVASIGDERILGGTDFVENALKHDELKVDLQSQLESAGWSLDKLVFEVCKKYGVSEQNLLKKTRHKATSTAKSLVCHWGTNVLGFTAREIAQRLAISHPAVSYRAKKGLEYCKTNEIEFEEIIR